MLQTKDAEDPRATRLSMLGAWCHRLLKPSGSLYLHLDYRESARIRCLLDELFGEKNFSGHLPVTFYENVSDLPDFEDYSMKNRTYRYFTGKPLYPFGYGLSYSRFTVSGAASDGKTVQAEVMNDGTMDGDAVVQVYVKCKSPFAPVHPRLCGFQRVGVKAGEKRKVSVKLDPLTDTVIETLSIIAYKQPVTRLDVENIRGVNCDHAINKLLEYDLITELGRLDAPGRPILFGTTEQFLRTFGVKSLEDLPELSAIQMEEFKAQAEAEVKIRLD